MMQERRRFFQGAIIATGLCLSLGGAARAQSSPSAPAPACETDASPSGPDPCAGKGWSVTNTPVYTWSSSRSTNGIQSNSSKSQGYGDELTINYAASERLSFSLEGGVESVVNTSTNAKSGSVSERETDVLPPTLGATWRVFDQDQEPLFPFNVTGAIYATADSLGRSLPIFGARGTETHTGGSAEASLTISRKVVPDFFVEMIFTADYHSLTKIEYDTDNIMSSTKVGSWTQQSVGPALLWRPSGVLSGFSPEVGVSVTYAQPRFSLSNGNQSKIDPGVGETLFGSVGYKLTSNVKLVGNFYRSFGEDKDYHFYGSPTGRIWKASSTYSTINFGALVRF